MLALFVDPEPTEGFQAFQTFSLDNGTELLIRRALLDRFRACMKPASITLRPLRAGVFFGHQVWQRHFPVGLPGREIATYVARAKCYVASAKS